MPASWPWRGRGRHLAAAVAGSIALHAAGLGWLMERMMDTSGLSAAVGRGSLQARLITLAEAPVALAPAMGPQAARPGLAVPSTGAPAATAAAPQPLAASSATQPALAGALEGFRPADQLTTRPEAISTGDLEPGWLLDQIANPIAVNATIYVASDGSVVHVEIRQSSDPRASEVVRKAFLDARFRPGTLQGRQVAARVDIGLYYEARRDRAVDPQAVRPPGNVLSPSEMRQAPPMPARQRDTAPLAK